MIAWDRMLQHGRAPIRAVMRHTRPSDELQMEIDVVLAEAPGVERHRWVEDGTGPRPWSAIEIQLSRGCDARCVHEIERRILSMRGVIGLGPHWPRPEAREGTVVLRIYRGRAR
jgi:hypothetical protein